MATNKKRPSRPSGSNSPNPPGAPRPASSTSTPRTARPARDGAPARAPEAPVAAAKPNETANYLVPGGLALALVVALLFLFRGRNTTPAEPASTPSAATPQSGDTPARAPNEPARAGNEPREGAAGGTPTPSHAQRAAAEGNTAPPPPPTGGTPQNVGITPVHPEPSTPDPLRGSFPLADATRGLPAGTTLVAEIDTSMGMITCTLWPDRAPNTVANFVGLARGLRDFWDPVAGRWTRRPYYDGTVFHRVIPDFMIQGGDILRSGRGGPGYTIPDENVTDHNSGGLLAMANRGPNTGGSQFFIQEDPRPHLNGSYSVFGTCTPLSLVERIARTPRAANDTPLTPVYMQHVRIRR